MQSRALRAMGTPSEVADLIQPWIYGHRLFLDRRSHNYPRDYEEAITLATMTCALAGLCVDPGVIYTEAVKMTTRAAYESVK